MTNACSRSVGIGALVVAGVVAMFAGGCVADRSAGAGAALSSGPMPQGPLTEFHVAPAGNDANPGTVAQPFATLARARDAVRARRQAGELPPGAVVVALHGGSYRLTGTLELTGADSGTAASPVIWRAAPGEEVRLVGGVRPAR